MRESLQELDTDIIPRGGSDIAGAIRTAMEAFGKGESEHRALIIFTDGEELDADGVREAEKQKDVVRIFTIGLGSPEGALIPVPGTRGGTEFVKDPDGQIVKSRLDEVVFAPGSRWRLHVRLQMSRGKQMSQSSAMVLVVTNLKSRQLSRQPIERYQWPLAGGSQLLRVVNRGARRGAASVAQRRSDPRRFAVPAPPLCPVMALAKNSGVSLRTAGLQNGGKAWRQLGCARLAGAEFNPQRRLSDWRP